MCEIIYKDYVIEHEVNDTSRYNLYKNADVMAVNKRIAEKHGVAVGDKTGTKSIKDLAYGISFEEVISRIVKDQMAEKENTFTLAEYMKEYKGMVSDLRNAIKPV